MRWTQPGPSTSSKTFLPSVSMRLKSALSAFPPARSQVLDIAVCESSSSGRWSTDLSRAMNQLRSRTTGSPEPAPVSPRQEAIKRARSTRIGLILVVMGALPVC